MQCLVTAAFGVCALWALALTDSLPYRDIYTHTYTTHMQLLVSARFEVKVADFGLSRIKDATHVSDSWAST